MWSGLEEVGTMLRRTGMDDDPRTNAVDDLSERMRRHKLIVRPTEELEAALEALYKEWSVMRAFVPHLRGCAN